MMSVRLPFHLGRAVLKPVRKCHVTVREVDRIGSPLRRNRILLRQYESHNLAKLDIVQEELYMDRVGLILCRSIWLIINKIICGDHLHIRIFDVDAAWSTKSHRNRSISSKQCPPYSLPQALVRAAELRMLDTKLC